jgi:hypothetical protein
MTKYLQIILLFFSYSIGSLYSSEPLEIVELSVTLRSGNSDTAQQKILMMKYLL